MNATTLTRQVICRLPSSSRSGASDQPGELMPTAGRSRLLGSGVD
jgi:hypothetical protein